MEKNIYKITKKDLYDLFARLSSDYRVFVPYAKGERLYFGEFDPRKEETIELGGIRQTQPVKSFLNPPREVIASEAKQSKNEIASAASRLRNDGLKKPLILAGVKACDLASFVLQDFVFLKGDTEDPFYAESRNNTIIISNDCTFAKETCFCLAMEGSPYPKKYFDINLSPINDFFIVEVASPKGEAIINKFRMFFKPHTATDLNVRQANREKVAREVRYFIDRRGTQNTAQIKGAVKRNYNLTALWQDFASTCVECGACNLVCPTCHCFLLFDEKAKDNSNRRYRVWDACLYNTFARVAGGANPRKHLYERLRNRFEKKFDFFPGVLNYFACTGCGRCIEACPGDIDLREVLKGLVSGEKWNKPPND
ncbi:MAG: 4Fe-4S dicluster domain-containing protein [Candidatus Omnitrophota bacterium]|nr:4Fe-4S dicluster domain-containing protein [Candidatus Omnitrophota bacterium]